MLSVQYGMRLSCMSLLNDLVGHRAGSALHYISETATQLFIGGSISSLYVTGHMHNNISMCLLKAPYHPNDS